MLFLDVGRRGCAPQGLFAGWRTALLVMCAVLMAAVSSAGGAIAASKFAAITVDARNGKLLYAENVDAIRHPASLTKMMTLYLLFEDLKAKRIKLDSPIRMSARAASMAPSKLGVKPGDTITVETAIRALVVKSANDVAAAVAENLGGTEADFARRMTRTARAIGMSRSTFVNASGLPNPGQVTTARDMATLGLRLMRDFPQYYPYFRTQSFVFKGRTIKGHNRLLGKYEGTDGIKTGYINASGFNLVTSVRRGDKRLVGVVLGGKSGGSRDAYMKAMLTKYFPAAKGGKTIVALAGSSQGAVSTEETAETKVADADAAAAPVKKRKKGSRKDDDSAAAMIKKDVAAVADPAAPEEGDTEEDQAGADQPALAAEADLAAAGATIKTVPAPAPAPVAPAVTAADPAVPAADPAAPAKLPFAVKSETDQLADQATVASIAPAAAAFVIQIGEYASKEDAQARIQALRKKVPTVLTGKEAQVLQVEKKGVVIYRARFAGFDEAGAKAACKAIKKNKSLCSVQAAS